jgi:Tol biopolymer transport system component
MVFLTSRPRALRLVLAAVVALAPSAAAAPPSDAMLYRVTVALGDGVPDGSSSSPSLSADGRFVAFTSAASNLVPDDTNALPDVFVHDRLEGVTVRVSVDGRGREADGASGEAVISSDGRSVAFTSSATNLVEADTNEAADVFVHDLDSGITELVSAAEDGVQSSDPSGAPSISADGRTIAFVSGAGLDADHAGGGVFVRDRAARSTTWIAEGVRPAISGDGRWVAFVSDHAVHLHDRDTGTTERVAVDAAGAPANADSDWPAISADGRTIAFHSLATNLVPDAHAGWDVYVHEIGTRRTDLVSVDSGGTPANASSFFPRLSADGSLVAFTSIAGNLAREGDDSEDHAWSLYVRDLTAATTWRLPLSTGVPEDTYDHAVSADGRSIVFASLAPDPASFDDPAQGVWEIFVYAPLR